MPFKNVMQMSGAPLFVHFARLYFGIWLFYVGLMKWLGGPSGFVIHITSTFEKAWIPAPLVLISAWIIIIAEPLLALWILSGRRQACAWRATAMLMFLLTFGQTVLQSPNVWANWMYTIFCLACAALSEPCGGGSCSIEKR